MPAYFDEVTNQVVLAMVLAMLSRQAIIHLDNLIFNLDVIKKTAPNSLICLAVKANGYGHGALAVSRVARECGVEYLGVATLGEAEEIRSSGDNGKIILLGLAGEHEYGALVNLSVECFGVSKMQIERFSKAAELANKKANIHLKIDTGMGRIGCNPREAVELAELISKDKHLSLVGLCTHFAVAETDRAFTLDQLQTLLSIKETLVKKGIDPSLVHAANSAGICLYPQSHLDMVRPGIMAYGYSPSTDFKSPLRPVMEVKSCLRFQKEVPAQTGISYGLRWKAPTSTLIGTVPIGYGDGLPRLASGKIKFLINDTLVNQVGTICMDQCMVDMGTKVWDGNEAEVVIFGPDKKGFSAQDIADAIGSIPYEILCAVSPRVPRVYKRS